ncbi:zinc transporter ZIP4-like isoform X2 [Convolutriloba macropyga]|uniref:zinc transporter ZIP4-like isoform X2 n=1 Tax=Convolutriloba macropyga TaxID=536237 RepID=UPI003F5223D5
MFARLFGFGLLLQLFLLQNVGSNRFETHYKTLIGNLEGETLEHIYDHVTVDGLKENAESFSEACLNESDLEAAYVIGNSSNVTSSELVTLCPALLYRALTAEECGHGHDEDHQEHDEEHETTGYGYSWGFLAVFLISLAPLLGMPLLLLKRKQLWFKLLIQFLIALGVATMACDSLLHLWPEAVGLHAHGHGESESHGDSHDSHGDNHGAEEEEEHSEDRTYLWRTVGMVVTIYVFFLFEGTCHKVYHMKKGQSVENDPHAHGPALASVNPAEKAVQNGYGGNDDQEKGEGKKWFGIPEDKLILAVVLSLSDIMCNFTDGLAIGTAFQDSSSSGISTSIAVACHEIPQEIGSFAILLDLGELQNLLRYLNGQELVMLQSNYGLDVVPIVLLNLFSAFGAIAGLFMGAGLSEYENFAQWMTAFAAGAFLYIALIDMFPQMTNVKTDHPWVMYLVQNLGLIIGFVIMLLIALYEEDINV